MLTSVSAAAILIVIFPFLILLGIELFHQSTLVFLFYKTQIGSLYVEKVQAHGLAHIIGAY